MVLVTPVLFFMTRRNVEREKKARCAFTDRKSGYLWYRTGITNRKQCGILSLIFFLDDSLH